MEVFMVSSNGFKEWGSMREASTALRSCQSMCVVWELGERVVLKS
jgi:hypothetical protein